MILVKPNNINFYWIPLFMLSFVLSAILSQFWSVFYFILKHVTAKLQDSSISFFLEFHSRKQLPKKVNSECKQPPKIMYYNNICCRIIKLSYSFGFSETLLMQIQIRVEISISAKEKKWRDEPSCFPAGSLSRHGTVGIHK